MAEGYNFKIVLLGEGCVGKTSCVLRYVEDKFNDKHMTTLQVHFPNIPGVPTSFRQEFSKKSLIVTNSEKTRESLFSF